MNKLQIYKASAGSGKTYLLTQKWLLSAFADTDNYSKILAVTFTNKAAEEMKTRILAEISLLISDSSKSAHSHVLMTDLKLSESELIHRANALRDNILHNYSLFSVKTIDSFVQRVIRAFSYELGVNSNYEIELDTSKVLAELTEKLYQNMSQNIELQRNMIQFAQHKIDEGKTWDFKKELSDLAKELFKEQVQEKIASESFSDKSIFSVFSKSVLMLKNEFEQRMRSISVESRKLLKDNNIHNIKELGSKFATLAGYLVTKIANRDFEPLKSVRTASEDGDISQWHKKGETASIVTQIESVYPQISQLLTQAVETYDNGYSLYVSAKLIAENLHAFGILSDLADLLPEYRADNNTLLISDTNLLLKEIIGNNDAPFIYEKTGSRYKHILIDEFQDTSAFQWANFRPLLENSLSENHFNLIVGDIKQSIYRWRGGDWKLLLYQVKADIGSEKISEHSLDTNWRSKKNILDFNNAVFAHIPSLLQADYNNDIDSVSDIEITNELKNEGFDSILTTAYSENYQKLPKPDLNKGGRSQVKFFEGDKAAFEKQLAKEVPADIDFLLKNKNYEPGDITVLVRTNKQAQFIMQILRDYQHTELNATRYPIVSSESLLIANAPAVRLLTSALRYLDTPYDTLNTAVLLTEYARWNNPETYNLSELYQISVRSDIHDAILPEEFILNINALKRYSLYELTEKLISVFKLTERTSDFASLQAFQSAVSDFTTKKNASLQEFLEWWNEARTKLSVQLPESLNALRIMTIHKSKGLAFKIAIVPFVNQELTPSAMTAPLLWVETDNNSHFNHYPLLPVRYKKDMSKSVFKRHYFNEKLYLYMDLLNVLYVAFTRPEEELFIYAAKSKNTGLTHAGDLLWLALNSSVQTTDKEGNTIVPLADFLDSKSLTFRLDTGYIITDTEKYNRTEKVKVTSPETYPNFDYASRISINYSSDEFFIESREFVAERVRYGSLMHKILSEIETYNDVEHAVKSLNYAGFVKTDECESLIEKVKELISRPNISSWFDGSAEVISEQGITTDTGELRIPDRILFTDEKVTVIDFKFGEPRPEHTAQITEYLKLIQNIYTIPAEAYLYYAENDMLQKMS